jgi:hypothetical protein
MVAQLPTRDDMAILLAPVKIDSLLLAQIKIDSLLPALIRADMALQHQTRTAMELQRLLKSASVHHRRTQIVMAAPLQIHNAMAAQHQIHHDMTTQLRILPATTAQHLTLPAMTVQHQILLDMIAQLQTPNVMTAPRLTQEDMPVLLPADMASQPADEACKLHKHGTTRQHRRLRSNRRGLILAITRATDSLDLAEFRSKICSYVVKKDNRLVFTTFLGFSISRALV